MSTIAKIALSLFSILGNLLVSTTVLSEPTLQTEKVLSNKGITCRITVDDKDPETQELVYQSSYPIPMQPKDGKVPYLNTEIPISFNGISPVTIGFQYTSRAYRRVDLWAAGVGASGTPTPGIHPRECMFYLGLTERVFDSPEEQKDVRFSCELPAFRVLLASRRLEEA